MPTPMLARRTMTDPEEFWKNKKVPRAYIKMFIFVYQYNLAYKKGPSWALIAGMMGWADMPRDEWRKKIQRGRRYGLKFRPGVAGSTTIRGSIVPYVKEKAGLIG